jgi:hypothetical protein
VRYPPNDEVLAQLNPEAERVVRSLYVDGGVVIDDDVFSIVEEGDWLTEHVPVGTITFMGHGRGGTVWLEDGRWVYSDFGDVCCSAHRPDGPDHGVYVYNDDSPQQLLR